MDRISVGWGGGDDEQGTGGKRRFPCMQVDVQCGISMDRVRSKGDQIFEWSFENAK